LQALIRKTAMIAPEADVALIMLKSNSHVAGRAGLSWRCPDSEYANIRGRPGAALYAELP
jgi:hypothetical protein